MSKGARNRRIKYWTKGDRSVARRMRRVYRWNGIMPGVKGRIPKSKQPIPALK